MPSALKSRVARLEAATQSKGGVIVLWDGEPIPDDLPAHVLVVTLWHGSEPGTADDFRRRDLNRHGSRGQSYVSTRDGRRVRYVGWLPDRETPWERAA